MESDKTRLQNPYGLVFSLNAGVFYVFNGLETEITPPAITEIGVLTPYAKNTDTIHIAAQVRNPINVVFDNKFNRLLILQFPENNLLEVRESVAGNLAPTTLSQYNTSSLGIRSPQGMAVDPETGNLFILDAAVPQIIRVEPAGDGSFDHAEIIEINLHLGNSVIPRALAFDPDSGHLFITSPVEQKLYELSQSGQIISSLDMAAFNLQNPQGMVFAPSGDQTDDPLQNSLYLADNRTGQIMEFSLKEPAFRAPLESTFVSSLLQTSNLAAISPPGPDPSGLAYLPLNNTLIISDSEVDETVRGITHFAGANFWEITLNSGVVRTANLSPLAPSFVPMTDEPTGVTWNPSNGHFYFSDDNAYKIFDLNPGDDQQIGSTDDTWTSFDTLAFGIGDPEGITFDTWHNQLFVVDGTNREIYQFSLSGSLIEHFDVSSFSVDDPEGIEFNPDSGTLFILSNASNRIIVETTISGGLLQTIDVSDNNAIAPAGLAYAPASDGSGLNHFYIVDRGIDNNDNPNIVDGKMYEMSAPSSSQPTLTPSPSFTPTGTNTPSETDTATQTPTMTFTTTGTNTATPVPTNTDTPMPTNTDTLTPTITLTPTGTNTATPVPTNTNTSMPTNTDTLTPTMTLTPTGTNTATPVPTNTNTPTTTNTDTLTPTMTLTPTGTNTATLVPTSTFTTTVTNTPTRTPTRTLTTTVTNTASPTLTTNPLQLKIWFPFIAMTIR